jgi:hypothetical protein
MTTHTASGSWLILSSLPPRTSRSLRASLWAIMMLSFVVSSASGQGYNAAEPLRQQLFNGQLQIAAGKRYALAFTTQSSFRNARIAGNVQAQGGTGNDIRVLVIKGQSLIYDSGRRRSVVMSVDFSEPGQYVLIFDNSFSLVSPKVVAGMISLVHWGLDAEQNAQDRHNAIEHVTQATGILHRLYAALKADERIWGTSQVFAEPVIRLNNDDTINAAGNWTTNSIQVNNGLFRLTDKVGEKGEDVLAATLAHEMGHIFYRHPGYGSSGPGVKGFFDELRGITALDRLQEKEADILGIRVACQAGFDAEGMLILIRVFAQLDSSASSFMKNHPAAVERYSYLQGEATKCHINGGRRRLQAGETVGDGLQLPDLGGGQSQRKAVPQIARYAQSPAGARGHQDPARRKSPHQACRTHTCRAHDFGGHR